MSFLSSANLCRGAFIRAAFLLTLLSLPFTSVKADQMSVELIPRQLLFGNPTRTRPKLNPDGSMMAFLAPRDGVLNIWVCPTGKFEEARPLTADKTRPIPFYDWSRRGDELLYVQDAAGDENFLLYAVNATSGNVRKLTDFKKTRVQLIAGSWQRPDELIIGINNRDPKWHDAWLLNIKTGELTLLHENKEKLSGYVSDQELKLRFATRSLPDGGWELLQFGANGTTLEPREVVNYEDSANTGFSGLTEDGSTLYLRDSRGRDKAVLKAIEVKGWTTTILGEDPRADIGGDLREPLTGRVEAYAVNYLRNEWHAIGDSVAPDLAFLAEKVKGEWSLASRTKDNRQWLIGANDSTTPGAYYLYNRDAKTVNKLFIPRPELEGKPFSPMRPLEIKTRDGLTMVSYLTLPPGSDRDDDGIPEKPVPLILFVHGGPWGRDGYGFNPMHQWMANRGYAVLSVNFRASTGFGKSFVNAGDKEWGARMHEDLIDAVQWAIAQHIAPADKVAIYGGSYGGYAALVGLTFTPEVFACGVDIVGPSNLATLLSTIPPYWEAVVERFARAVGDVRTEDGRRLLAERSPLTRVSAIQRPLLIGQGANDPRVKQAESDQIVSAMKTKGIPVTYVLYPDEGHGFARPQNSTSFNAVAEAFLAKCLGGRFEPVGKDFQGATLQVLEGADAVPGLAEAIPAKTPASTEKKTAGG